MNWSARLQVAGWAPAGQGVLGGLAQLPAGVRNLLVGAGTDYCIGGFLDRDASFDKAGDHHRDGLLFGAAGFGKSEVQGLDDGEVAGSGHQSGAVDV